MDIVLDEMSEIVDRGDRGETLACWRARRAAWLHLARAFARVTGTQIPVPALTSGSVWEARAALDTLRFMADVVKRPG